MEDGGRLELVPANGGSGLAFDDSGRPRDDTGLACDHSGPARDAVETGFVVLLEIWHSALGELVGDVPPGDLRILLIVSRAGRVSIGRLASALGAPVPAAIRICTRMEAAGLLGRSRGAAGGSLPVFFLTAHARRLVAQIQAQRSAVLNHVLQSLTPAGRASLASALAEFAATSA
jgi:DNA-binding MarR family transcriptional regulator